MAINLDALIGGGTTLLAVPLTWWLSTVTTARANARAERDQTRSQADALLTVIADLKAVTAANHVTTESLRQRLATHCLAQMAFWGGFARTGGPMWRRVGTGGGELARWLGQERHEERRNLTGLPPLLTRVFATAAPLLRHPDPQVTAATEELIATVNGDLSDQARLDAAMRTFGQAVQHAVTPRPSWWAQLPRRVRRARANNN
ncbi:hypothetical protein IPZ61_05930 [Streptomyces sioyaensis]|uniref:hypothetical protein n=1 Tax=Streptomyces sioyaensis TaxID=67364 RepID=UPI001F19EE83|nr:hypothetical protein [Streptomyces sioyaensis]MCF3172858.1 hypothetical protein [Streptomyces sioyaensis]